MDNEKKTIADKVLSSGVVPVRFSAGSWRLLVLRADKSWDFPTGVINVYEDSLEAAKRETTAATDITDLEFVFGEDHKETVPYAGNNVGRYYVAETHSDEITLPVSRKLGRPAHDEWRWVTCDEAEDLLPPRLTHVLAWVRERIDNDA